MIAVLTIVFALAGFTGSLATVLGVWIDIADRARRRAKKVQSPCVPTSTTVLTAEMHHPPDLLRR